MKKLKLIPFILVILLFSCINIKNEKLTTPIETKQEIEKEKEIKIQSKTNPQMETNSNKIMICADMLELGNQSRKLHREMGRLLAGSDVQMILGIGTHTKSLIRAVLEKNSKKQAFH